MVFNFYKELCIRLGKGYVWMCAGPQEIMFQWHFGQGSIGFKIPMSHIIACQDKEKREAFFTDFCAGIKKQVESQVVAAPPGLKIGK
jgi:hypothetical protein